MAQHLTHYDTLDLQRVVPVGGDLLLLPREHPIPYEEYRALREGDMIDPKDSSIVEMTFNIYPLIEEYLSYRNRHGREPNWINNKPVSIRTAARRDYAIHHEDVMHILNRFPNTGLSYMINEGGLCEDVARLFTLWRLQNIRQLGFLQAPWFQDSIMDIPVTGHNRYVHSLDVMTIASVIGHNNDLPRGLFNTLRAAAISHDMGTPAGGDSVKWIDQAALDEDLNYGRLLKQYPERKRIWRKYGISEKRLVETIHNKGVLGQILDIADKLAYVARDLWACEPYLSYGAKHLDQYGIRSLMNLVEQYPNPCGIWDSIKIVNGTMVVENVGGLRAFLKIRTLLFRELYMHPNARFGEYLVSRVLVKALYDNDRLTRDQLLAMDDNGLRRVLDEEYSNGRNHFKPVVEEISEGAQCKTFRTREEAVGFYNGLRAQGNPFALLEDNTRAIKTGTHFNVPTKDGPRPFVVVYPGDAREIEEMAMIAPAIHVYYLEREPAISRKKLAELVESMSLPITS